MSRSLDSRAHCNLDHCASTHGRQDLQSLHVRTLHAIANALYRSFHPLPCQAWIREQSSFFLSRSCNRRCPEHWTPTCYCQERCYPKLLRYTANIPKTYSFENSRPQCCQDFSRGALPLLLLGTTTMLSQIRFQGMLVSPASVNIGH